MSPPTHAEPLQLPPDFLTTHIQRALQLHHTPCQKTMKRASSSLLLVLFIMVLLQVFFIFVFVISLFILLLLLLLLSN